MGNRAAVVRGTFMRPGVSKNKRLYTKEAIAKAVNRMQEQLNSPEGLPLTMATSHGAAYQDDALSLVGRVTAVALNDDGSASFEADIANTTQGRDVATLVSGNNPFLKSISIRGEWLGDPMTVEHEGQKVTTAKDFAVRGIDFTSSPGVTGANIEDVELVNESALDTHVIFESVTDFDINFEIEGAENTVALLSEFQNDLFELSEADGFSPPEGGRYTSESEGIDMEKISELLSEMLAEVEEADTTPYGDVRYADPGYQSDGVKRYPIDSNAHCRAAWSYINQEGNSHKYTAAQLARVKSRIKSAAKKFGINIVSEHEMLVSEIQDVLEAYASIALVNDDDSINITGYATDPHQLKVVANRIAFGAIAAMHAIDPDDDGDIYLSKPDWSKVDATGDAGGMGPEDEEMAMMPDDNNMESTDDPGVATDSMSDVSTPLYCPSCNLSLPLNSTECTECGGPVMQTESYDSLNNKEAPVADTENVAEVATESAPEAPARSLTDADLQALAMVTAEAVKAAFAVTQVKEEAPTEAPEVADEAPEVPEVEAVENTQEGDVAEYSADDVKKAVAEALDSFKSEVAEAYRENGAPRKGLVTATPIEGDVEEDFSPERLATMGTREFRESQYEAWGNVPFFQAMWNRADSNFGF